MKTILIVDDEYDIVSVLEMVLLLEGYLVRTAYNGEDAFESIKNNPYPDLIILDIMMPVLSGYAFIAKLRATPSYDKIPIIIASSVHLDPTKIKKGDWDYFILKPFDLKKLIFQIEKTTSGAPTAKERAKD